MAKKILLIGLAVVALLVCGAAAVAAYIAVLAVKDATREEFTPLNATPLSVTASAPEAIPGEGAEPLSSLAYIKVLAMGYSDDADPADEGLSVDISFYDTSSQLLDFSSIPIPVTIRLYAYRNPLDVLDEANREQVYEASLTIDHSMRLGEMFGSYIRVPYDQIPIDHNTYAQFGKLEVTIQTPGGSTLTASAEIPVALYPSP